MSESSIIKLGNLVYHNRLDADFYKPTFLKIYKELDKISKKYPLIPLTDLIACPVRTGKTQEEREPLEDKTDVLFIKTDSVRKGFINYGVADLLPLKAHEKQKLTSLKYGDIVVTVVGATPEIIARAGLYLKKEPANINQSDALIRVNDKIEAGYLSTFINSKYGRNQLWRYSGQTGQVTMNCREVEQLNVVMLPENFREKIHEIVLESEKLREKSKQKYSEAEQILIEELNLKESDLKSDLTYKSALSKTITNNRLDPEFYMPKYDRVKKHIDNYSSGSAPLNQEFNIIKVKFNLENTKEYDYIEISDISIDLGDYNFNTLIGKELPANAKIKLKGEEVLVSKVRPTRGAVSIIENKIKDNLICSSAFTVLKEKGQIKKEVLAVFLRSIIGKGLLGQSSRGTSYPRTDDDSVLRLKIPLFKKLIQEKIKSLIQEAYELKQKSKELLEEAKLEVEKKIESI